MTFAEKAHAAWGKALPDWIRALVEACSVNGLRATAARLDLSPAMVSLALNNKRKNLQYIKARVEAVLMISIVACPVLGVMGMHECLQEQKRGYSAANPLQIQLYRACRDGCPHYRGAKSC